MENKQRLLYNTALEVVLMKVFAEAGAFFVSVTLGLVAWYGQQYFPSTSAILREIVVNYDIWHTEAFLLSQGAALLICIFFAGILKAPTAVVFSIVGFALSALFLFLFVGPEAVYVSGVFLVYLFGISLGTLFFLAALIAVATIGLD